MSTKEEPFVSTIIHAVASIVVQQTNTHYPGNVPIVASLLFDDDEETPCLIETYQWRNGDSLLGISFDITNINIIWPEGYFCNNTEIVGIGLAQSIRDCRVFILDAPADGAIIEANIEDMFSAVMSTVTYENADSKTAEAAVKKVKPADLIFLTDYSYDESSAQAAIELLVDLIQASPRVIIALTSEAAHADDSVFGDVIKQSGDIFCGRIKPIEEDDQTASTKQAPQFTVDVFRGNLPP